MSSSEFVYCQTEYPLGIIRLNRPQALNALNLSMIRTITHQLIEWEGDPRIYAVVIAAVPGRAFCAGGDVRSVANLANLEEKMQFFSEEYRLNQLIYDFKKPYIALMDGITMGGGVGISLHGSYPLATEKFVFAMPETRIGFYPDIGASYILSRCPDHWGMYLGLTGTRMNADQAMQLGLIYGKIASSSQEEILQCLGQISDKSNIDEVLEPFLATIPENLEPVDACFAMSTIEEIVAIYPMPDKSPLSLKITFEQLKKAPNLSLAECLHMDYQLTRYFMQNPNFNEGIRALLIDKDNLPKWQPASLEEVSVSLNDIVGQT